MIIDTAPILSAASPESWRRWSTPSWSSAGSGRTTAGEAERCGDLLDQLSAPALGVALVGVAAGPLSDYFSYVSPRKTRQEMAKAQAESDEADADAEAAASRSAEEAEPGVVTDLTGEQPPPPGANGAGTEAVEPQAVAGDRSDEPPPGP